LGDRRHLLRELQGQGGLLSFELRGEDRVLNARLHLTRVQHLDLTAAHGFDFFGQFELCLHLSIVPAFGGLAVEKKAELRVISAFHHDNFFVLRVVRQPIGSAVNFLAPRFVHAALEALTWTSSTFVSFAN
jgi:hypothetical protein